MQQKLQKPEYSYIAPSVTFTFYKTKCSTVHLYLLSTKMFHCVYINPAKQKSACVVVLVRTLAASNDDHVARRDRRFEQRYKLCSYLTSSATVVL
jgi:hypothetical protein